jgi:pimeloyl-ACP methyl ester carboxylesterase
VNLETGTFLGRIPYTRIGSQPDPILVLAGGQAFVKRPTHARVERDAGRVARLFPANRSFILLGYDPSPAGSDSLDAIVADVVAIVRELGAPRQVVGISYGGVIALQLAAQHPSLVSVLVLIAGAHDFSAAGKRRLERQIDCASRGDLAALVQDFIAMFRRPWLNWLLRLRLRTRRARLGETMNDPPTIVRALRTSSTHGSPIRRASRGSLPARSSSAARTTSSSGTACLNEPRPPCRTRRHRNPALVRVQARLVGEERRRGVGRLGICQDRLAHGSAFGEGGRHHEAGPVDDLGIRGGSLERGDDHVEDALRLVAAVNGDTFVSARLGLDRSQGRVERDARVLEPPDRLAERLQDLGITLIERVRRVDGILGVERHGQPAGGPEEHELAEHVDPDAVEASRRFQSAKARQAGLRSMSVPSASRTVGLASQTATRSSRTSSPP